MTDHALTEEQTAPVTNSKNPDTRHEFVGPGMRRRFYLDQLRVTGYTGWYDQDGVAAPWPADFCAPGSGWQPAERESIDNGQPY
ncbi:MULTISPECIES: hypothetical protein [Mycobacteriaceae]|uniref:Uncharacterized protein n=2 Tax=Mycobacteriaceae TaxID=1762 RepID=A0A1A0MP77_MYCMU|nr:MULTISPECIES: hypothetical protein [Mycobacteriaceae]OBA86876.1 hypothetical protein A5642_21790 [Mycolicibacterium mucogenicum]OHU47512.1 hypothetical protein BKG82_25960 [Mycobacteroides chelonae]TDK92307.1 hypothetical protein EUA03_04035 [Mycolicibacterium mucogenicum]SLI53134.1 Uncharacterised protein [Mycobacteroides abscessus subsp. abscessus]SLJ11635.1 Uncharacterised protein [Mycobacteroides abscessus subsp. abscessus]